MVACGGRDVSATRRRRAVDLVERADGRSGQDARCRLAELREQGGAFFAVFLCGPNTQRTAQKHILDHAP